MPGVHKNCAQVTDLALISASGKDQKFSQLIESWLGPAVLGEDFGMKTDKLCGGEVQVAANFFFNNRRADHGDEPFQSLWQSFI